MIQDAAEAVARAVLYEGYLLYPYYASSTKNRHRFQFGGLYPASYTKAQNGADRSEVRTEFLLAGAAEARLVASFRGLQLLGADSAEDAAEERKLELAELTMAELLRGPREGTGSFGGPFGAVINVRLSGEELGDGLYRVRAEARNATPETRIDREAIMRRSLLSAHFLFTTAGGRFLSQIDPPAGAAAELAAANRNEGLFPVLVGSEERHDQLLAAPLILYDFPRIAPESRGDLFDGLEIDEILSLRIRTLTDAEKAAVRATGPRAAALLDRTEGLSAEELLGLHGAKLRPEQLTPFRPGDRVRLNPRANANSDIFDLALAGRTARIESVEQTLEDECLLAVSIDDDPGRDLGSGGMPGHRFFFRPDEVERLHA